ncbi:MAG: selenide, water dikinase SelD, partial [Desulfuromonadales bacterium]|nr:selenide, water dikinase SelD [Desulfuromonadales bacterium]
VNDPRTFGRIAAANALSDVYAMGAKPLTVMNLVGFPTCLEQQVLVEILQGSAEKVQEAGAVVVGGHTVEDDEPKFGLAVTGLIDPQQLVTTKGAKAGDRLILTKPLGSGILATALKGEVLQEKQMLAAIHSMETLNKTAAEVMLKVGVNACTDVTGFGLLGHIIELAEASEIGIELTASALHVFPQVLELAEVGLVPTGSYRNREHYLPHVVNREEVPPEVIDIIADPQTSGGLLMVVAQDKLAQLSAELDKAGCDAFEVGQITEAHPGKMRVV